MAFRLGLAACAVLLTAGGCGGDGTTDEGTGGVSSGGSSSGGAAVGGATPGGTGGGPAGGNSSSGGMDAGGSSTGGGEGGVGGAGPTGGTGGSAEEAHCAPGDTYGVIAYQSLLKNCGMVGGVGEGQAFARSINIEAPIGPGDTYAFSVEMGSVSMERMEIWGATEECGDGLELLATATMGEGIRCMDLAPQEGTYSHLTWVWYAGGVHGDVTFCPTGACSE